MWLCLAKLGSPSCIPKVPAINSFPESHPDVGALFACAIVPYKPPRSELAFGARSAILYLLCLSFSLSLPFSFLSHTVPLPFSPRMHDSPDLNSHRKQHRPSAVAPALRALLAYSGIATLPVTRARPAKQTFIYDLKLMFRHRETQTIPLEGANSEVISTRRSFPRP